MNASCCPYKPSSNCMQQPVTISEFLKLYRSTCRIIMLKTFLVLSLSSMWYGNYILVDAQPPGSLLEMGDLSTDQVEIFNNYSKLTTITSLPQNVMYCYPSSFSLSLFPPSLHPSLSFSPSYSTLHFDFIISPPFSTWAFLFFSSFFLFPSSPFLLDIPLRSCRALKDDGYATSGLYYINPDGYGSILVFCDMSVAGSQGWIVFQRRVVHERQENFQRSWKEYSLGFGRINGSFWLGLERIHRLTQSGYFKLYVGLQYHDPEAMALGKHAVWAMYGLFFIDNEAGGYRITVGDFNTSSTAGDSLRRHNGMRFSTLDRDNDLYYLQNCAELTGGGGWWFRNCLRCNLNGMMFQTGYVGSDSFSGIRWSDAEYDYSFKQAVMLLTDV